MNRSKKYLEYSETIADSLSFLQNAQKEKQQLEKKLQEYLLLTNSNKNILLKFPALIKEIQSALTIKQFNWETAQRKIDELKKALEKLTYAYELLNDMEEIQDPILKEKLAVDLNKNKFIDSANKLLFQSIDTLHFEMQNFEQLFKKISLLLKTEKQKCEKVKSLIGQDLPLLTQFPIIELEIRKISEGEIKGSIGPDYIISNYSSVRDNLSKLNEFSKYFSRLSGDYLKILSGNDLQIFQTSKKNLSLSSLSPEFMKINAKATAFKNQMIKLDTLRNQLNNLRKELNEKIEHLSPNHQNYVREEMIKIQQFLFENLGFEFEKSEQKINTIKEVLKKEFKTNDQKATDVLYIRQSIAKYEHNIWQEDFTLLFERLNEFAAGKPGFAKDDFSNTIQKLIKQRNEMLELAKAEFELFFAKNRDYKNRFEKIANTKSSKKELEILVSEMSSFKPLKNIFYKFLK